MDAFNPLIREGKCLSLTILIPIAGNRDIHDTIQSIIAQNYPGCEILILHNGIQDLPEGTEVTEKDEYHEDLLIRELFIRKLGKGNALNEGICHTESDLVCVLDADCILHKDALANAVRHFSNADVAAVGGRLLVRTDDSSMLETIQFCEYTKTFHLNRRVFAWLNAQCLISGAFGIFRRSALLEINGYDTDTVGEDMELVLRLQEEAYRQSKRVIVYEPAAICHTAVPHSLRRLMRQRDRWQRGLMDCLIKHHHMILNPHYGLLGTATLFYQLLIELLGPVFWILYMVISVSVNFDPLAYLISAGYALTQIGMTLFAVSLDHRHKAGEFLKLIPGLVLTSMEGIILHIAIMGARLYGMITFHWRRMVW